MRDSSRAQHHTIIVPGHVENCDDRQRASKAYATNQLRFDMLLPHSPRLLRAPASRRQLNEPMPTVLATPFSEGIDSMTDNEQVIAQAIARAFETLSERLSKKLADAFNQMAHLIEREQKQHYAIMALFGKQAAAIEALANLVARVQNDGVERHDEHATAIQQLSLSQMKIAQFTDGLATQYGQLFKALSNRLDVVEKEAFGPNYDPQPSTPPLN
jgi:hypothetical protein